MVSSRQGTAAGARVRVFALFASLRPWLRVTASSAPRQVGSTVRARRGWNSLLVALHCCSHQTIETLAFQQAVGVWALFTLGISPSQPTCSFFLLWGRGDIESWFDCLSSPCVNLFGMRHYSNSSAAPAFESCERGGE